MPKTDNEWELITREEKTRNVIGFEGWVWLTRTESIQSINSFEIAEDIKDTKDLFSYSEITKSNPIFQTTRSEKAVRRKLRRRRETARKEDAKGLEDEQNVLYKMRPKRFKKDKTRR